MRSTTPWALTGYMITEYIITLRQDTLFLQNATLAFLSRLMSCIHGNEVRWSFHMLLELPVMNDKSWICFRRSYCPLTPPVTDLTCAVDWMLRVCREGPLTLLRRSAKFMLGWWPVKRLHVQLFSPHIICVYLFYVSMCTSCPWWNRWQRASRRRSEEDFCLKIVPRSCSPCDPTGQWTELNFICMVVLEESLCLAGYTRCSRHGESRWRQELATSKKILGVLHASAYRPESQS